MKARSVRGSGKPLKASFWNWRWAALLTLIAGITYAAVAEPFQLVSVLDPSQGPPAGGSGDSWAPIISPDGRYVLFASTANNLVRDQQHQPDPGPVSRRRSMSSCATARMARRRWSASTSAGRGAATGIPAFGLSTNGRYALFESSASDLVPGDTNNAHRRVCARPGGRHDIAGQRQHQRRQCQRRLPQFGHDAGWALRGVRQRGQQSGAG